MCDAWDALLSCGIPKETCVVLTFYLRPETISEIIRTMKGGETHVDPMQPEPAPSAC